MDAYAREQRTPSRGTGREEVNGKRRRRKKKRRKRERENIDEGATTTLAGGYVTGSRSRDKDNGTEKDGTDCTRSHEQFA